MRLQKPQYNRLLHVCIICSTNNNNSSPKCLKCPAKKVHLLQTRSPPVVPNQPADGLIHVFLSVRSSELMYVVVHTCISVWEAVSLAVSYVGVRPTRGS